MGYRHLLRRDPEQVWYDKNPILANGEPGVSEDNGKFKLGNGHQRWRDLPYFEPVTPLVSGITEEEFMAHIQSSTPHPVYDDLPSLTLLFENGLV